jgi:hypothetical protein
MADPGPIPDGTNRVGMCTRIRANRRLRRLINDCGAAVADMGCSPGFLLYEAGRREWMNVVLILGSS